MGQEYRIKWTKPADYDAAWVLRRLPSPISSDGHEIYNYSLSEDGSYFVDQLTDRNVAARALQIFIDDALGHTDKVEVSEA